MFKCIRLKNEAKKSLQYKHFVVFNLIKLSSEVFVTAVLIKVGYFKCTPVYIRNKKTFHSNAFLHLNFVR